MQPSSSSPDRCPGAGLDSNDFYGNATLPKHHLLYALLVCTHAVTPLHHTLRRTIGDRPVCKETGATLHFVDDRLDTLLAVQQAGGLDNWKLYLADW